MIKEMTNTESLTRTLFIHDNLPVLRGLDSESVDLIATDPPFNKNVKDFSGMVDAGDGKGKKKVSYKDTWTWKNDIQGEWTESIQQDHPNLYAVIRAANAASGEDMGAYLCYLGVRVLEMQRILKPTGSLYLHIDHTASHYLRALMDAIFGRENFRNDIAWCYTGPGNAKRWFPRKHDNLLYYTRSDSAVFNPVRVAYTRITGTGHNSLSRGNRTKEEVQQVEQEYAARGKQVEDWWTDFPSGGHISKQERTGYPTQKPLALYERIVTASSNPGDIVLDPFCGCATTCIAAERLGREWIGIDNKDEARSVILARLQKEAQLPSGRQSWNRAVSVKKTPPKRTDGGAKAAPELVLVSEQPKAPRISTRELRASLVESDGLRCQGCGWVPHHEEYLEVDHKVPKSAGGRDDLRNRVLLCSPCNGAKSNRLNLIELREKRLDEDRMADKTWNRKWFQQVGRFG